MKVINVLADGTICEDISKVKIRPDHMVYRVLSSLAEKYPVKEKEKNPTAQN